MSARTSRAGAFAHALRAFAAHNAMPVVAVLAAAATCVAVPPDAGYAAYVDWATLGRLSCVLAAVAALQGTGAFQALAARLAGRCRSARVLVCALVGVTALASMLVTNDMALVALLPLAAAALLAVGRRDLIARTYVLQGVAANLCGMLLPFGNPQNIYLTGCYGIGFGKFVAAMAAPFALSSLLVAAACALCVPGDPVRVEQGPPRVPIARTAVYSGLLAVCVASVLGAVPVPLALALVFGAIAVLDRRLVARIDWGLIVTFAAFFVFSGNLARIDAVHAAFSGLMAGGAFVPAALLSQVVSNVPAAVLLSRFTGDWQGLLAGVNVGGAGTPVASLATLIVVTQFAALARRLAPDPATGGRLAMRPFAVLLLAMNAAFLAILLAVGVCAGW